MKPENVNSPKSSWMLIDVLFEDGGDGDSLAVGKWDGKPVLAARWNGEDDKAIGNPQSRGLPTWFVLPEHYNRALLENLPPKVLPAKKKAIAMALLGLD
ncbi:MAG TPA: hypothetical protein VNF29_00925 [Candidatus Binataceae bacterium]|nr:hypothetical protein [Candidatus Binataceae bacterium]